MIRQVAVLILLALMFPTLLFARNYFSVADDMDAAPYIFADPDNRPAGLFYDIMTTACNRLDVPLRYEVYPWKRAQILVKNRQADALITVPTPQRLRYLVPGKEPVFTMTYKLFAHRKNPRIQKIKTIKTLADLAGLKIIDYIGDGWAEKNLQPFGVTWAPNLTSACSMIAGHRGDVFLQDEIMVLQAIKNIQDRTINAPLEYDKIVSFPAPVAPVRFHLLIHKNSRFLTLLPKFDDTLRSIHRDGTIQKIINQRTLTKGP